MLPTYNERENIAPLIERILAYPFLSIVVVDDSSPDGTGEIADRLARRYGTRLHVIHRRERGRAGAGIVGLAYACTQDIDFVIEMDADFSHQPEDIPRLIAGIGEYDVVVGSRAVTGGEDIDRSWLRTSITRFASLYTQLMLGSRVHDWSGGFKCYRRRMLAQLPWEKFYSRGYSIGAETLYRLLRLGASIHEIPICFQNRRAGKSKFNLREIIRYFWVTFRLRLFS